MLCSRELPTLEKGWRTQRKQSCSAPLTDIKKQKNTRPYQRRQLQRHSTPTDYLSFYGNRNFFCFCFWKPTWHQIGSFWFSRWLEASPHTKLGSTDRTFSTDIWGKSAQGKVGAKRERSLVCKLSYLYLAGGWETKQSSLSSC